MTALSDLRVVDLSVGVDAGVAGAFCAKMFADFGADVIKVESPEGDPARGLGPFPDDNPDADTGGMFMYLNTNKRGITLDLDSADGLRRLRDLCATADVVVETFSPGHVQMLGLGYDDLDKISPGVVLVSVTPFGQTGPWRRLPGHRPCSVRGVRTVLRQRLPRS